MQKYLFALVCAVLFSGCSMFDSKPAPAATPNEPIKVEMEITGRSAAPAPEAGDEKAVKKEAKKPAKTKKQSKAAQTAAKQERVILPEAKKKRGGVDGELNPVEQSYLDSVRESNQRTREENASKVFGGWGL